MRLPGTVPPEDGERESGRGTERGSERETEMVLPLSGPSPEIMTGLLILRWAKRGAETNGRSHAHANTLLSLRGENRDDSVMNLH
jgi:hypothetical protein